MKFIPNQIEKFCEERSSKDSKLLRELTTYTKKNVEGSEMLCGSLVGSILQGIICMIQAKKVLEIGTYTGYSALKMIEVLPQDGTIDTCEIGDNHCKTARSFFNKSDKGHNINEFIEKNKIDIQKPILTLFPGSRKQEIKRHLSLFVDAALHLKSIVPELQILLGLHSDLKLIKSIDKEVKIIEHDQLKALEIANAAIISSGTATLQSAIMGFQL